MRVTPFGNAIAVPTEILTPPLDTVGVPVTPKTAVAVAASEALPVKEIVGTEV
jgi:hypothetical protein